MKTITSAVATVLMLLAAFSSAQAAPRGSSGGRSVQLTKYEHRLVEAVNEYREERNLPPLSVDPTLMRVARRSAPHFNHCINGKWCWHRTREAGFSGWATDNIANGYPTPEDAVQGWATSHGHAMQMRGRFKMNGQYRDYKFNRIGVGISGRKYIAVFGRDNSQRPPKGEKHSDG